MINAFTAYIRNLAAFLVFMSFVRLVAPHGKYRAQIDLCLGFILVLAMIQPIGGIISSFKNPEAIMAEAEIEMLLGGNYVKSVVHGTDMTQDELIIAEYKSVLAGQLEVLINAEAASTGLYYYDSEFAIDDSNEGFGDILSVSVIVSEQTGGPAAKKPLIRVEKVTVAPPFSRRVENDENGGDDDKAAAPIKKLISNVYKVPGSNIYITIRRG